MWIDLFKIEGFRNLEYSEIHLENGINLFSGQNGQGKTSVLEAVYFLLTTKSFKTFHIQECARHGTDHFVLQGQLNKKEIPWYPEVDFKKPLLQRWMNKKKVPTLDYIKMGAIMVFSSYSTQIIQGSPQERRKFLDHVVSLLDPQYLLIQSKYRRQLKNLKKILFSADSDLSLFRSFKKTLIPLVEEMVDRRIAIIKGISEKINHIYSDVFSENEFIELSYKIKNCADYKQLIDKYMQYSAQELLYRKQYIGPHLDDFQINLNGFEARKFCSSGQVRSTVLSLIFAVREMYFEKFNCYPILLMDDIDSELDDQRMIGCMEYVINRGQILLSSTKYVKLINSCRLNGFEVKNGNINSLGQMNG